MGSRLGRRVVNFANLPIKLLMPSTFTNIKEIALKTIPSASKIEIKRVLESLYGFEVEKVRTLNMEGKKWKRNWLLMAKPDYKKAYVTLKHPLSISSDLFPIRLIEENKTTSGKKGKSSIVEESEKKRHWLEGKDENSIKQERGHGERSRGTGASQAKFPWSYMKSGPGR
ncbi:39S ribosomal protein L23, mitochondrial [Punica granatum]|uniref:Large ribosomal subunit protein uL23m n=2 Tax=Punica granatum TaxID=22663 RepID=A0A218W123_PUNGR|nr:39S ribosomal protein L23, mitochondrial [Punica granatum]OWM66010.1 hypothetical protein CDL15_Pgr015436 [Punica granatum]PKI66683.1 hypothetical protein CRG98_012878 [Punica granatum]